MDKKIKPIASHCLIMKKDTDLEKTKSGIYLIKHDENFKEGIVVSIGNKLDADKDQFDKDLQVGSSVLFDSRLVIYEGVNDCYLVPFNAIVALLDKVKLGSGSNDFFKIPSYDEIMGKNIGMWKDYLNIKSIRITSKFLTPFSSIEPIFKLNHELVFETLNDIPEVGYKDISGSASEKKTSYSTQISDDVWDGIYKFEIDENGLDFEFRKINTDVENICKTLPKLLEPYANTMRSNLFQKISEQDFSKAKRFLITINQEIKLMGEGTLDKRIKNSEVMQQFLKLKTEGEGKEKSLLGALSFDPEDIGRIDLNISFSKIIKNNMYHIFLYINAAANDENSLLDVTWSIIDNNPGVIPDRNFGEVFSEFFIKTVIQGFYHRWFKQNKDINVITLKK
jgi:co-chaperonin GroES (HSP10)